MRFSQALGFEGYPELQQAAIEEYRQPERQGEDSRRPAVQLRPLRVRGLAGADHANVEETVRNLTREQVEASVTALATRAAGDDRRPRPDGLLRQLHAPPAGAAGHPGRGRGQPSQDNIQRLSRMDEDSLLIAISAGPRAPDRGAGDEARPHRRASTMAITDATLSDIGEHSELTLYYSSNGPSYTRSNAALMAIVQALAHGVYARDKAAYKDRIRAFKLK